MVLTSRLRSNMCLGYLNVFLFSTIHKVRAKHRRQCFMKGFPRRSSNPCIRSRPPAHAFGKLESCAIGFSTPRRVGGYSLRIYIYIYIAWILTRARLHEHL